MPDELIEAARIDGALDDPDLLARSCFPALRPAAAVLGPVHLHGALERLHVAVPRADNPETSDRPGRAVEAVNSGYYNDQALIMAGTLLATLPLVVVFILFGRQIIGGIMEGGVKA